MQGEGELIALLASTVAHDRFHSLATEQPQGDRRGLALALERRCRLCAA